MPIEANPAAAGVAHRRRSLLFLGLAVAGVSFTMSIQMGLNTNFLVEQIHVDARQQGLVEAFRESCGIAAFAVLALLAGFAEPLVGAGMLVLLAAGLSGYAFVHDYRWVIVLSLVWSQGLHAWMPLPSSMTLALAEPGRAGYRLGQIGAAGAVGTALGLGAALGLAALGVSMRPMYIMAGCAAVLAAAACLGIPRNVKTPGPRLVMRRRYWLYYLLSFLEGWRKQVFLCFAPFLLIHDRGTSLWKMLILYIIVQVIAYFASPRVGRLIDRIGERRVLVIYYVGLIGVFAGYALVRSVYVLYALFIADSVLWMLVMALTTYVNRIAPASEHTPTLSMGVAMNHVAAVTMPLVGGILWTHVGYQWTFAVGALAVVLSILASLCVPAHAPRAAAPVAEPAAEG
jgi:predicted MFS family arabinose efflux permease